MNATVYERHRLWSADGIWERLLQQVQAAAARRVWFVKLPCTPLGRARAGLREGNREAA